MRWELITQQVGPTVKSCWTVASMAECYWTVISEIMTFARLCTGAWSGGCFFNANTAPLDLT